MLINLSTGTYCIKRTVTLSTDARGIKRTPNMHALTHAGSFIMGIYMKSLLLNLRFYFFRHRDSYPIVTVLFRPFGFIVLLKTKFGFLIFWPWGYLVKGIPETCRVHYIYVFINVIPKLVLEVVFDIKNTNSNQFGFGNLQNN
jgi:hypothetical protein